MSPNLTIRLLSLFAVFSLVLVGAASAFHMAPDREEAARHATMIALGGTRADICSDDTMAGEHDCPLCHKLPDTPQVNAPQGHAFTTFSTVVFGTDVGAAPRAARLSDAPARAPPVHT